MHIYIYIDTYRRYIPRRLTIAKYSTILGESATHFLGRFSMQFAADCQEATTTEAKIKYLKKRNTGSFSVFSVSYNFHIVAWLSFPFVAFVIN